MFTWQEIKKKYKDEWVAITEWKEDECGEVLEGHVAYHGPRRDAFYDYINEHFKNQDLAIRYTGKVRGPFLLRSWQK